MLPHGRFPAGSVAGEFVLVEHAPNSGGESRQFRPNGSSYRAAYANVRSFSRFLGIVIGMFFNEHGPPHFHAVYGEHATGSPWNASPHWSKP
jgi:hypothetical protein